MVTLGNPILANVDRDLWPHIRKQTYRIHILPILDGFSDWPWFTIGLQTCPNRERWLSTSRWKKPTTFKVELAWILRDFPAFCPNVLAASHMMSYVWSFTPWPPWQLHIFHSCASFSAFNFPDVSPTWLRLQNNTGGLKNAYVFRSVL